MRNTIGKLMIAAATLLAAQVFIGCGDSDSDTASSSGGSGNNGGSKDGSGKDDDGSKDGSDGKDGSGDSFGGAPHTACLMSEVNCQEYWSDFDGFVEKTNERCEEDDGEVVTSCPSEGLSGRCLYVANGVKTVVYFYGNDNPGALKQACESAQGEWKDP